MRTGRRLSSGATARSASATAVGVGPESHLIADRIPSALGPMTGPATPAANSPDSGRRPAGLSSMWRVDVRTLGVAERALWAAFPHGGIVDLTGRARAAARPIRAEVIAALLLGAA